MTDMPNNSNVDKDREKLRELARREKEENIVDQQTVSSAKPEKKEGQDK